MSTPAPEPPARPRRPSGPESVLAPLVMVALLFAGSLMVAAEARRGAEGAALAVPVLMYHHAVASGATGAAAAAGFRAQIAYLHDQGAVTITPMQLRDALTNGTELPAHSVVLTFDDGYADFATVAAPVLRQYGFTAVTFVVTGDIGRPGYMTAADIRRMAENGMVVGSHSLTHPDLAKSGAVVARHEVTVSKLTVEQIAGTAVADFAYPYGSYTDSVVADLRAAGYSDAFTTAGGNSQFASSPFTLSRTGVSPEDSLPVFAARAGLPPPAGAPASSAPGATGTPATEAGLPPASPAFGRKGTASPV